MIRHTKHFNNSNIYLAVATCEKNKISESVCTDRAATQPQKQVEPEKNIKNEEQCISTIHQEHTTVPQFLALLEASAHCSSLDPDLHCSTHGRCILCRHSAVPIVNAGCSCSLCIYCALFLAQVDPVFQTCGCRKNILPFSQWTGVSDHMKQPIRQLAKKNQADPYVHSPYNDLVDILSH